MPQPVVAGDVAGLYTNSIPPHDQKAGVVVSNVLGVLLRGIPAAVVMPLAPMALVDLGGGPSSVVSVKPGPGGGSPITTKVRVRGFPAPLDGALTDVQTSGGLYVNGRLNAAQAVGILML